jgi:esterase/lipase superfamily enzyme/GNAT superfamily N-acetyltransferase
VSKQLKLNPRHLILDYLGEYELGQIPLPRRRNVNLRDSRKDGVIGTDASKYVNYFGWHAALELEGREDPPKEGGIWPINSQRCERRFGNPGADLFPSNTPLRSATPEVYEKAFQRRLLFYHRVANSSEAKELLATGVPQFGYASEITSEWYDPPDGHIIVETPNPQILASHAVTLLGTASFDSGSLFAIQNSWGELWGLDGFGSITEEHFDRFMIEAWNALLAGFVVPYKATQSLICLEWKWSADGRIGVHAREIVDAGTDERLAWAFCQKRGNYLDVEEFFVWPTERGKGYGRRLAQMVHKLAKDMNLPLRLLVSYADSEPPNRSNLEAAARLLGVTLAESGERWVHLIGTATPVPRDPIRERPLRPAVPLEKLRPSDEPPIVTATDYLVHFGTNRTLVDGSDVSKGFSSEREQKLQLGRSLVRIPMTPRFGCRGRFWVQTWNTFCRTNPQLMRTELIGSEAELGEELRTHFFPEWGEQSHNLLFVHGFNTSFDDAVSYAAQLGVDLKVSGLTFCYSWPSAAKGIKWYGADGAALDASLPTLEEFIGIILRQTGDAPLSILVHSMGNRAVIRLLESIMQNPSLPFGNRIRNLIFAAPDVDADVFRQSVPKILSCPRKTTLYVTPTDLALKSSKWIASYGRAGLSPPVITLPSMDTVQVEGFNLLDLAHSYYREAETVLHDLFVLFHFSTEPSGRRNILSAKTAEGHEYWRLPVTN